MPQVKSVRVWFWGMIATVIAAVGDAGFAFFTAPNLVKEHWRELLVILAFTTGRTLFMYMKQTPIPVPDEE